MNGQRWLVGAALAAIASASVGTSPGLADEPPQVQPPVTVSVPDSSVKIRVWEEPDGSGGVVTYYAESDDGVKYGRVRTPSYVVVVPKNPIRAELGRGVRHVGGSWGRQNSNIVPAAHGDGAECGDGDAGS